MPVTCWTSCPPPCCHLITWDATEKETGAVFVGLWDLWGHSADVFPRWNLINLSFEQRVKDLDRSTECFSSSEQLGDIYASPCLPNTSEHSLWSLSTTTDNLSALSAPLTRPIPLQTINKPHSSALLRLNSNGNKQEVQLAVSWAKQITWAIFFFLSRCCLIISWW